MPKIFEQHSLFHSLLTKLGNRNSQSQFLSIRTSSIHPSRTPPPRKNKSRKRQSKPPLPIQFRRALTYTDSLASGTVNHSEGVHSDCIV
ncbi:hypothetical protein TNCV_2361011 [Trichonephila clavipes]|nr:hypothetical protein TNCV_2361011 [Trichonephila clavipes]